VPAAIVRLAWWGADHVVGRRYEAGLRNLFASYISTVDGWQVYDNSDLTGPGLIVPGAAGTRPVITDPGAWKRLEDPVA
jgi:predicted ABC-type ATPase